MKKNENVESQDFFTFIAQNAFPESNELECPEPIPFDKKVCELKKAVKAPCKTKKKISTKEELYEAVSLMRKKYSQFFENHAPNFSSPK